jgi:hypothetical protein
VSIAVAPAGKRRAAAGDALLALLTGMAAWAAVLGYFTATGRRAEFVQAVFTFNESFAGSMRENVIVGFAPRALIPRPLWGVLPLAALVLVGMLWSIRARRWRVAALWLAYALGTAVAVALPGKSYAHYYQLWLPVYCVGAGIGVQALAQLLDTRPSWWPNAIAGVALAAVLAIELPSYAHSAENWSIAKYRTVFVDVKRFAPEVAAVLDGGETFFEWGDEAGFYYYTGRRPPSRFLYLYPAIVASPMRAQLAAQLLADLRRTEPELLIVNTSFIYPGVQALPVTQWIGSGYYLWERGPERGTFKLFIRRGGALEGRLRRAGRL